MDISFHWHNVDQSDAIQDYTTKKIEKLTLHFNNLMSAVVRFKVEKINQIAEVTIHADGDQFVASDKEENLYAAIDLVEAKLEKQIRRHKEKMQDKKRHPRP